MSILVPVVFSAGRSTAAHGNAPPGPCFATASIPQVCFGKPCIRGHRLWISLILDLFTSGWSTADILENYPGIEGADILACIAYGAEMSRERYVDPPVELPA